MATVLHNHHDKARANDGLARQYGCRQRKERYARSNRARCRSGFTDLTGRGKLDFLTYIALGDAAKEKECDKQSRVGING